MYYTIELEDGIYEFPISTVENTKFITTNSKSPVQHSYEVHENEDLSGYHTSHFDEVQISDITDPHLDIKTTRLSKDLGETNFQNGVKASELIRWISKALKSGELIKRTK